MRHSVSAIGEAQANYGKTDNKRAKAKTGSLFCISRKSYTFVG